ncbi:MAG: LamG-like jellyroll fold domain-containing protein [Planctomycetota bacterium]
MLHALLLAATICSPTAIHSDPVPASTDGGARAEADGSPAQEDEAQDVRRFLTNRASPVELPLPDEDDAFFFVVYGDRTGGPREGIRVLEEAVAETNLLGPDLVMTVGDLIQGYNSEAPWIVQMAEYRGAMARLRMPWFPVAGNHDIYYRPVDRAQPRPPEEHEGRYEEFFGPLWYAFEHKGSWFIVLYTDEPNPDTGERNFNKAECQRMSPEQLAWLDGTLEATKDADHVFVFVHHPRWIGRNYGDDWEKVHERLVRAGNVSAVFGGHIHHMRHDPRDGIEYFALATVGGHIGNAVPSAGALHCFDVVTVRKDRIERATIPVGATMDPREITAQVAREAPRVYEIGPHWLGHIALGEDGAVSQELELTLTNPVGARIEAELTFRSPDPRWTFAPDHVHGVIDPSGTLRVQVRVLREKDSLDGGLQLPVLDLGFDYLTDSARFAVPRRELLVPVDLTTLPEPEVPELERALVLDGRRACVRVPAKSVALRPDESFTLETWVRADAFKERQALIAKSEQSDYAFFASEGRLEFIVFMEGTGYVGAALDPSQALPTDQWLHVAGVYDRAAAEVRLYVNGRPVAATPAPGDRRRNDFPLFVGADPNRNGDPTSTLRGALDGVRLTRGALYGEDEFTPERRPEADADTVLLLHMDESLGPYVRGGKPAGATLVGGARVAPAPGP